MRSVPLFLVIGCHSATSPLLQKSSALHLHIRQCEVELPGFNIGQSTRFDLRGDLEMTRLGVALFLLAMSAGLVGCRAPRVCTQGAPCAAPSSAAPSYAAPSYSNCTPVVTSSVVSDCAGMVGQPVITSSPVEVMPSTDTYLSPTPGVVQ